MPVRLRLKQSFFTSSFYCLLKRWPHGRHVTQRPRGRNVNQGTTWQTRDPGTTWQARDPWDYVAGTGPRDYVAGTWPRDYVAGTWPRDYVAGTWPRDHVAGTWSRENNETWTQHMAIPPPHLIWLYLPSWYTNNAGLCHISDMGTFSKQVQKYINGYISRKIPYCKTLRQVQDVLIRIPDDFTLHFDSDTGWLISTLILIRIRNRIIQI